MSLSTTPTTQQTTKVNKHPHARFGIYNLVEFTDEEYQNFMDNVFIERPSEEQKSSIRPMSIYHLDKSSGQEVKRRIKFSLPQTRVAFAPSRFIKSVEPKSLREFKVQVRLDIHNNQQQALVYNRLRVLREKLIDFVLQNKDLFKNSKKITDREDACDFCDIKYIVEEQEKINEKTGNPYDPLLAMNLVDNIEKDGIVLGSVIWDNSNPPQRIHFPEKVTDENITDVIPKGAIVETIIDLGTGYVKDKNIIGFTRKLSQMRIKEVTGGNSNDYREVMYENSPFEVSNSNSGVKSSLIKPPVVEKNTTTTTTFDEGSFGNESDVENSSEGGRSAHEMMSMEQAQKPMSQEYENEVENSSEDEETHSLSKDLELEPEPEPERETKTVVKKTRKPRATKK